MTPDHLFREVENADPTVRQAVLAGLRSQEVVEEEYRNSLAADSALSGMLCLMKDNFDVAGLPTQASSTFLETVRPEPHPDGAFVRRVRECGAVIAGKTQMNEFAYGLDGANPHFGDCPNPFDPARCSGGSSSGSAFAVAKGWVPVAFGTDTGGSVRVPAAFCGIYGFRLPPNEWALDGVFPLAPSYDSVGWFTQTAEEMRRVSQALLGVPEPEEKQLRILSFVDENHPLANAVQQQFPQAVFTSPPQEWGTPSERVTHYNVLQSCEAYEVHRHRIETYADDYSPAVRKLILRAQEWTTEQKRQAKDFEAHFLKSCEEIFTDADVILLPVSDAIAPIRPMTPEQRSALLEQTTPGSLGRLPVLTIPVKVEGGRLGLQCMFRSKEWADEFSNVLSCL